MTTLKLVYVAGPFTARPDEIEAHRRDHDSHFWFSDSWIARKITESKILKCKYLGLEVAKLGACPWIPHANTDLPEFEHAQPYTFWIEATLMQLRKCDAVIFTDDWQTSSGARGEHAEAMALGLPGFYDLVSLAHWLDATGHT